MYVYIYVYIYIFIYIYVRIHASTQIYITELFCRRTPAQRAFNQRGRIRALD